MNRALDAFTLPICLARPRRWSGTSAWVEHVPFAMNLVAAIAPRTIVELGTHGGVSYCAFCQAVVASGSSTRCYAVDSWRGDSQAGTYGPEVLSELQAHHDPLYGQFSRLVQATFDEALPQFEEGTIDLLHIDGFHSYEAVRHDFDAWLPKLSRSGVVLLHDIHERSPGFGVWQLWDELRPRYPSFDFVHGHGLGVLAVGDEVPSGLRPLLDASEEDRAAFRSFFFELGRRLVNEHDVERLREELASAQARVTELTKHGEAMAARVEALAAQYAVQVKQLEALRAEVETRTLQVQVITNSAAWSAIQRYRTVRDRVLAPGTRARRTLDRTIARLKGEQDLRSSPAAEQYRRWIERNEAALRDPAALRAAAKALEYRPSISVVTPVYDVDERWLRRCIESVLQQSYDGWELCLVDDASTAPHVQRVLAEYAARDPRVRTRRLDRNSGIAAATTAALAMATGEFVAFLDHDDELSADALASVVSLLEDRRDLDLVYSDEDKLDERGNRCEPFFKPEWSPDLLLSMNYVCHLTVARRSLVEEVGGVRAGFEGSQDHDLLLRLTERTDRIGHVSKILYHWRKIATSAASAAAAKPYATEAGRRAVQEALERRHVAGRVDVPSPGRYHPRRDITRAATVSIVIPTRNRADLLRACLSTIETLTTYRDYEVIVLDNGSDDPAALQYLDEVRRRHRVLEYSRPFNWSAINNFAVQQAKGEYLLFLNNDIEVLDGGWLGAMVEQAQRPEVGAVGAKLLYPDGRLQHAGVVLGIGGVAGHALKYAPGNTDAYFGFAQAIRDVTAVTGACMMVRREVFDQVGRFDERLRVAFNDIDFCLKLRKAGYLVVYTPLATLRHHESATRRSEHPPEDEALMRHRWAGVLDNDPYYSPNLSLRIEDYSLRA